ncbi:MAG TPA: ATP-binding protein [Gemmatimonadaceae bacterium]|nr:ATP-binding protein [Gemmatimonadaceae bacterium]
MVRWSSLFDRTDRLIGLSQLACVATLGVVLTSWWYNHDVLLDGAFIASLAIFTLAAAGIARRTHGVNRGLFAGFAAVAALAFLAQLLGELLPGSELYRAMHAVAGTDKAIIVATLNAVLPLYAGAALADQERAARALERSVNEERAVSALLESRVSERTVELEDAQRVLQRMWVLGQEISLELDPQRVLDRFVDAARDVARADGAAVALLHDDGTIRVTTARGSISHMAGLEVPVAGSVMGRVLRTGHPWLAADVETRLDEVYRPAYEMAQGRLRAHVVFPISRRGERIGTVTLVRGTPDPFPPATVARVEAMADLLVVALENAELVETLRRAEWRFRTLFRAAPDAVFSVLQSGRVREANDAARDVLGLDPIQIVGRNLSELVPEDERERLDAALADTFAGRPARLEVSFVHASSGRTRAVSLAASRLPEADPPSVLVVARDITAEQEMRLRLMESDRLAAVGELVAGVAHEVNNPLSSISAFAQLLLRDAALTGAQREQVEVIRAETMRASQVVKDLLAFARRSAPRREPVDLNSVVARTLRMRGYQLSSSHIRVAQALGDGLPAVMGDARQLQQVCLNLITNAVQAMEPLHGGTLTVVTRTENESVILEVGDTGTGIPAEARSRIFEPFFTTKKEGEGTGLGLSVSYGIVTEHGGKIELAGTSATGTTFRVTLPPAAAPATGRISAETQPLVLRSPLSGLRLLFVDDEPSLCSSMATYGKVRGFTVLTAPDGEQALEIVRQTTVDAVVSDVRMPGMDGFALHNWLRLERPGLAARTVFITGDVVAAGNRGAARQPMIPKPFTFERLEEALVAVLRGWRMEDQEAGSGGEVGRNA